MIPLAHKQARRILFKKNKLYEHVKENLVHISKGILKFHFFEKEGNLFSTFNLFSVKL